MSTMSSPLKRPVSPRKVLTPWSWSSSSYRNCHAILLYGQIDALFVRSAMYSAFSIVQPVNARAHSLMSSSV